MSVAKVLGIETEYGILGGPDGDPITASSLIVNAYAQQGRSRVRWDFVDESPGRDARGDVRSYSLAPAIETHLANTVLTNGARLYVDHAHPEYSSPEVRTPMEAVLYDQAGEEVLRRALIAVNETLPPAMALTIYKNNSDGKGNSYGTHENYLVDRAVPFPDIVRALTPHFISRIIVTGAGKVGSETDESRGYGANFQVSSRAEFFEELVGLETTLKRPIINTRDEPHSDAERFRRLHVINGDANMSPIATLVKVGSTSILLAVLEARGPNVFPPLPQRPVSAFHAFARDTSLTSSVPTDDGQWSALDYQWSLLELATSFVNNNGANDVASSDEVSFILSQWRELLEGVSSNVNAVADRVDWVAKQRIVTGYQNRHGLLPLDAKLRAIDLQYHDIRPERSLSARAGLRQLFSPDEIAAAVHLPPRSTRAYFRGMCVDRFAEDVVSANWDSLVFDVGSGPLRRIPMMDPLRGTAELTEKLFIDSQSAIDLVVALND
jgi:proteasome accessory factor A